MNKCRSAVLHNARAVKVKSVVDENIKTKVMEKITKAVGVKTESKGICISLPIDNAVGIIETDKAINQVE